MSYFLMLFNSLLQRKLRMISTRKCISILKDTVCYLSSVIFTSPKSAFSFLLRGVGGSRKNDHEFPFFRDVELCERSLITFCVSGPVCVSVY